MGRLAAQLALIERGDSRCRGMQDRVGELVAKLLAGERE